MTTETIPPGLPPAPYLRLLEPPDALGLVTRKLRVRQQRRRGALVLLATTVLAAGVTLTTQLSETPSQQQELAATARDVNINDDVLITSLPDSWRVEPVEQEPVRPPAALLTDQVSLMAPSGVRVMVTVSSGTGFSGYQPNDPPPQPGSRPGTVRGHHAWLLETTDGDGVAGAGVVRRVVQWLEHPRLALSVHAYRSPPTTQDELAFAAREVISRLQFKVAAPASTAQPSCSDPVSLDRISYVDGTGKEVPAGTPGAATRYHYASRSGGTIYTKIQPPVGWKPVGATDAELAAFGFAPRPNTEPGLSDWNRSYGAYKGTAPAGKEPACPDSVTRVPQGMLTGSSTPRSPPPQSVIGSSSAPDQG